MNVKLIIWGTDIWSLQVSVGTEFIYYACDPHFREVMAHYKFTR